ncbi:ATP-binding protein [Paenibacillus koleovorans]|uniref:ATP-binding protein n=1 Tax=Paenibacillus koleovorans TaxID=121608 RepID=UPI000FDAC77D|nr:ATP-binding protein [Paenibacillus koleovorans]
MEKLSEKLVVERSRLFVGRDAELEQVHRWIRSKQAQTEVLFVSGIGGIGKTSFMMRVLDMAVQAKLRALWIDARVCMETPAGFVEALFENSDPSRELPPEARSASELLLELAQTKTVLCIDNYDALQHLDGWLRERFLPQLPATGVLVLLVARPNLSEPWQRDIAWRNRVRHIELQPFLRQELIQYCFRIGLPKPPPIERLLEESQGLPLALALTAEKLQLAGTDAWPISMRITAELMREVTTPELSEALDVLCLLPQSSPHLLNRLLRTPLDAGRLLQLSRLSFVRPAVYGLALHDVARHYLLEEMSQRDPERVRSMRGSIIRELVRHFQGSSESERAKLVAMLLSVSRDSFQLETVAVFPQHPDRMELEAFTPGDLPHLLRILQEQASLAVSIETDLAVLRELASRYSASIRVFRSKQGAPLAFVSGFYLYRETTQFHEAHFPGVLERAYPDEIHKLRSQPQEQADTYFHLLAGATSRDAYYDYPQLVGLILTDSIVHRSAGLRFVMINTYDGINTVLQRIGYRMRPLEGIPDGHPFRHAFVRELDWRASDIGGRILELMGLEPESASPEGQRPAAARENGVTEKTIMSALPLVQDAKRLGASGLTASLGMTGEALREVIGRLLEGEPVYPLEPRHQQVLRQLSEAAHLTAEAAADQLHVSRATYFRIRRDALRLLRDLLESGGGQG